jgi:hypothetical protein
VYRQLRGAVGGDVEPVGVTERGLRETGETTAAGRGGLETADRAVVDHHRLLEARHPGRAVTVRPRQRLLAAEGAVGVDGRLGGLADGVAQPLAVLVGVTEETAVICCVSFRARQSSNSAAGGQTAGLLLEYVPTPPLAETLGRSWGLVKLRQEPRVRDSQRGRAW